MRIATCPFIKLPIKSWLHRVTLLTADMAGSYDYSILVPGHCTLTTLQKSFLDRLPTLALPETLSYIGVSVLAVSLPEYNIYALDLNIHLHEHNKFAQKYIDD